MSTAQRAYVIIEPQFNSEWLFDDRDGFIVQVMAALNAAWLHDFSRYILRSELDFLDVDVARSADEPPKVDVRVVVGYPFGTSIVGVPAGAAPSLEVIAQVLAAAGIPANVQFDPSHPHPTRSSD